MVRHSSKCWHTCILLHRMMQLSDQKDRGTSRVRDLCSLALKTMLTQNIVGVRLFSTRHKTRKVCLWKLWLKGLCMSGCTALDTNARRLLVEVLQHYSFDIKFVKFSAAPAKPRQRVGRSSRLFSTASCCHSQAVQHCWASAGSLNQSRQQSIALCSLSSHRLGFLDLSIEELVEGSNQLLWWTLLDDGTHFVSKTY